MAVAPLEQKQSAISAGVQTRRRSEWTQSWRRFRNNRAALFGLVFIALICFVAIFADLLVPYDPTYSYPGMRGGAPTLAHPMGFDHIGRDLLSRVIYGSRVALLVGLFATVISVLIGVIVGAAAGYFGGWTDSVLSRIIDALMAFPLLALLIVLSAVLGPSLTTTITVIGITAWARFARVVRADVMSVRQRDYVLAARASGVKDARIIWRHVVPNVMGPVIVLASLGIGGIIILESALSFLGLGVQPPTPSWGGTLADGRALIRQYPHITTFPGLMIFVTVLAFNLLGDGVRDALDPRQQSD
ncbi:MAG: ABC transporter permease [Caldilineaceae bacterium]|nr:ABC transporter permease [Caldilineaceae bacterium]